MSVLSTAPDRFRATPDFAFGSWRSLFICCWRMHTTVECAQEVGRRCAEFAASHPEGIALLTIIEAHAPAPNNDARTAIADFPRNATYVRASALAFEGTGFRASLVRSVVSGLTMLARQPFEHKVFDSVPTATQWLVPELECHRPADFSPAEATQAVDTFRTRVETEVPKRDAMRA